MKKYLIVVIAFIGAIAFVPKAQAALTFVSTSTASKTTGSPQVVSVTSYSITKNNLVLGQCLASGGGSDLQNTWTVTSSDGTPFTEYNVATSTAFGSLAGFYGIASSTASVTITCNNGATVSDITIAAEQFSGNATAGVVDTTSTTIHSTAVTSSTDSISTTNANDVVVTTGYANSDGNLTSLGTPFTATFLLLGLFGEGNGYYITSSVLTSQTFKWTFSSSPWGDIVGSFKAASSASPPAGKYWFQGIFDWIGSFIFR